MCSVMVVCVLYPRFELLAALGDRRALLSEPAALAPEAGREQVVGEVSAPAEAFGVVRGMRLGEACRAARSSGSCRPTPRACARSGAWCSTGSRGSAPSCRVRPRRGGLLRSGGLEGIHGGDLAGVLAAARRALGAGARFGAAPSRFAAHAAALQARPQAGEAATKSSRSARCATSSPRCPWASCAPGPSCRRCPRCSSGSASARWESWRRCPRGRWPSASGTRGCSRSTSAAGATLRWSRAGRPSRWSSGSTCPRLPRASSWSGRSSCWSARVLARRERRGRSLRALAVSARFVAGGTWRIAVTLRHASADPARIRLALAPRLAELPAPAESLALEVEAFGPPAQDQGRLLDEAGAVRRARLGEAVRQARQAAGADAALRVLDVDPGLAHSRAPRGARAVSGRPCAVTSAGGRAGSARRSPRP